MYVDLCNYWMEINIEQIMISIIKKTIIGSWVESKVAFFTYFFFTVPFHAYIRLGQV